jgi:hypothetical protein
MYLLGVLSLVLHLLGVLRQKEQLTFLGGLFFFAWSIDLCGFLSKIEIEMCELCGTQHIEMCCFCLAASIEKCKNGHAVQKDYIIHRRLSKVRFR